LKGFAGCGLPGQGVFAAAAADEAYLHDGEFTVTMCGILRGVTAGVETVMTGRRCVY
jgi:hypothetical protein